MTHQRAAATARGPGQPPGPLTCGLRLLPAYKDPLEEGLTCAGRAPTICLALYRNSAHPHSARSPSSDFHACLHAPLKLAQPGSTRFSGLWAVCMFWQPPPLSGRPVTCRLAWGTWLVIAGLWTFAMNVTPPSIKILTYFLKIEPELSVLPILTEVVPAFLPHLYL